jgi:DNA-binding beta-propeller fold protein YncE
MARELLSADGMLPPLSRRRRASLSPTSVLASVVALAVVAGSGASCSSSSSPANAAGAPSTGGGGDGGAGPGTSTDALAVHPSFDFESGPVRPVALSPDGSHLFVANTANASLDIFAVSSAGLTAEGSVFVGVDPVAVAARTNTEVWVVNTVSDSVSIVDTSSTPPHVVRTLLVGDEPSDIVFAGAGGTRAFITTAHRGQQRTDPSLAGVPGAGDPQLTAPGIGRADVWVFDAQNLGTAVGGVPVSIVTLFGDTPRALAVTPDGKTVYAAIFKSGNQSTATSSELPCPGFDSASSSSPCTVEGVSIPGAPPEPPTNYAGVPAPAVAVLLRTDASGAWRDELGRDWSQATELTLPDEDVFALDATSLATTATYLHVGTTLFDMAVNPVSGAVYVSNTEARNDLRFEGPGTFTGTTLQGHLAESRITVLGSAAAPAVTPRYLNKHIDYAKLPAPAGTADHSLATPTSLVVSADGKTMYIAAFGSSKVAVLPTAALEDDSFDPTTASDGYITVSGGGPGGLVLDEANGRLYVSTRFDDGLSIVDLASGKETAHLQLTTAELPAVTGGRRFLYDATVSSSNGEAACASCHMFGDDDHLAWDLGNPDADVTVTPINIKLKQGGGKTINGTGKIASLHPNKGPMTTQTFRGMVNHGPMHWRGDRVSGFFGTDTRTAPPYDSELAFKNFIGAFNSLLGLGTQFSPTDMQSFSDFALSMVMPPNPVRALDNSLTASQANGKAFYKGCVGNDSLTGKPVACDADDNPSSAGHFADGVGSANNGFACNGCHVLDPAQGFFGTDGESSFESLPQTMKIPQLRNLYDKVGMFGVPALASTNPGNNGPQGPQVRGFGFTHDGSVDTVFRFLTAHVFDGSANSNVGFTGGDPQRRDVEQFLLAFDSDLAPIVGQQVTLRSDNGTAAGPRIDLLIARARTPFVSKILGASAMECDLVARSIQGGGYVSYRLAADGSFASASGATLTDAALRAFAATPGQEVTYTCMPPGWLD